MRLKQHLTLNKTEEYRLATLAKQFAFFHPRHVYLEYQHDGMIKSYKDK